jgi:hypothetical protein
VSRIEKHKEKWLARALGSFPLHRNHLTEGFFVQDAVFAVLCRLTRRWNNI